jgi:t-SNARE complex subunit (syntaxin)
MQTRLASGLLVAADASLQGVEGVSARCIARGRRRRRGRELGVVVVVVVVVVVCCASVLPIGAAPQ